MRCIITKKAVDDLRLYSSPYKIKFYHPSLIGPDGVRSSEPARIG